MGRQKPEMVELDQNEYIFGENGGRGAPAATFFRRIATMAADDDDVNSEGLQRTVGAGTAHVGQVDTVAGMAASSKKSKSKKSHKSKERSETPPMHRSTSYNAAHHRTSYFDLDDDWDANLDGGAMTVSRTLRQQPRQPSKQQPKRASTPSINDPAASLVGNSSTYAEITARAERDELNSRVSRIMRFQSVLDAPVVDIEQLRKLAWTGVPADLRPRTWMQLLGYLPLNSERRSRTLEKKRKEYLEGVAQVFSNGEAGLDQAMWHQISIDIPRTNPHIPMYAYEATQRALERILYLWALRHPASGYVQGINDLVTPFFQTFLTQYVGVRRVEDLDPAEIPKAQLDSAEADSYWCLTKLLDGIQDNYIHAQPGIHRQVDLLGRLVTKIDSALVNHLENEGVGFMQFSFRWMNCLLMRELPMNCTIRVWDTYLSEGSLGFSAFHVYVCAAFLVKWAKELKTMDFQDIMIFLQGLPTKEWGESDVELLLSEAFMYQSLFKDTLK